MNDDRFTEQYRPLITDPEVRAALLAQSAGETGPSVASDAER
jgi:hypothetical protein